MYEEFHRKLFKNDWIIFQIAIVVVNPLSLSRVFHDNNDDTQTKVHKNSLAYDIVRTGVSTTRGHADDY